MTYTIIEPPEDEPVTLAELQLSARLDDADGLNDEVQAMAKAARELAEHEAGIYVMPQKVRLSLSGFEGAIEVSRGPVRGVSALTYWDGTQWAPLSGAAWVAFQDGAAWRIEAISGWPSLPPRPGPRVRVDMDMGWADAGTVPECIKRFIKAQACEWLNQPSDSARAGRMNPNLARLLDPVRTFA